MLQVGGTSTCKLLTAVREGKEDRTAELLSDENFYNLPSWNQGQGIVLLREALARGHHRIAKLLLNKGARVNNKLGHPTNDPLHYAVGLGENVELIRLLLNEGAKINSPNCDGSTPLHIAITANNELAVRILLEHHANIELEDLFRSTPLHIASNLGLHRIVEMLLEHGAHPDAPLFNGMTPLHLACYNAKTDTVALLIKHSAAVNAMSDYGTPLDVSFRDEEIVNFPDDRTTIVSMLLEAGSKVNAIDQNGKTILHRAVEKNCVELVAEVIKYASINSLSFDMSQKCLQTPLQIAAQKGYEEIVDLLIARGADINMTCNTVLGGNYTSLHLACSYGHLGIVQRLVKAGGDLDEKTLEGRTPLHAAVRHIKGNGCFLLQIVQFLFDSGAKIDTVDTDNYSLLHDAVDNHCLPLARMIVELAQKANINVKAYVNATNTVGATPLHIAAANGYTKLVEFLLDHGANINAVDSNDGFTPLHVACKHIHVETIKLLLSRGAPVNALSTNGQTPAHVVLSFPDKFYSRQLQVGITAVTTLLEYGSDIDASDKNGNSLLNLAVQLRCIFLVQAILEMKPNPNSKDNKHALRTAVVIGTKYSDDVFRDFSFNLRVGAVKENRSIIEALQHYGLVFNDSDIQVDVLHHAIRKGYINIVQYLLENGEELRTPIVLNTALHIAVGMLQAQIVKLLVIGLGADVNAIDKYGKTPIYYITEKLEKLKVFKDFGDSQQSLTIAEVLLSNGAKLDKESKFLILATQQKSRNLVEMALKRGANVNVVGLNGCTALHAAVKVGDDVLTRMMVEHGAEIEATDDLMYTPLMTATVAKGEVVVNYLLDCNADVNVVDDHGNQPLHFAASWGCVPVVERLLELGADVNAKTKKNVTPLLVATEFFRGGAAIALLRGGADVTARRSDGATPLHLASEWSDETVVENLIYYGSDTRAVTSNNMTPLGCSLKQFHPKVVRTLLEHGGYTPGMCCCMNQAVRWFNKRNMDGCTDMSEVMHLHFLELEARQQWEKANGSHLCNCRMWFKNELWHDQCENEIESLKSSVILKGLLMYDLLTKPKTQMVSLARNGTVASALKLVNFNISYPIFGKLLKYKWESAVTREKLLSKSIRAFNTLMVLSVLGQINSKDSLERALSSSSHSWMLNFFKTPDGRSVSHMSTTDFAVYIKRIHSILPDAIVENILANLSDSDLRNFIAATKPARDPELNWLFQFMIM